MLESQADINFVWPNILQILQLCEKLNENKSTKILVIGGNQLIRHLSNRVNGRMTKQEAIQHYNSQGVYMFIKHNR